MQVTCVHVHVEDKGHPLVPFLSVLPPTLFLFPSFETRSQNDVALTDHGRFPGPEPYRSTCCCLYSGGTPSMSHHSWLSLCGTQGPNSGAHTHVAGPLSHSPNSVHVPPVPSVFSLPFLFQSPLLSSSCLSPFQ